MDCNEIILSENCLEFFVQYFPLENVPEFYGADCIQNINAKYDIAYYMADEQRLINVQSESFSSNFFPRCFGLANDQVLEATGIAALRRNPNLNLYGNGVIIGFVDSGIDFAEKTFRKADGTTRIIGAWNQSDINGTPPENFLYGSYYDENTINTALAEEFPYQELPLNDEIQHGSYIAAMAAGTDTKIGINEQMRFSGAAPQADIAYVKLKPAKQYLREYYYINEEAPCYQETDIVLGVKFLIELASRRKQPIVIVLALGTNLGGHDGSGILEEYLRYVSGIIGSCIITAAGNEGGRALHFRKEYSDAAQPGIQDTTYAQIRVGANEKGFTLSMHSPFLALYGISIISPSGQRIIRANIKTDTSEQFTFLFDGTRVFWDVYVSDRRTGGETMVFRFDMPSQGVWEIGIVPEMLINNTYFDMWLPIHEFLSSETYFLNPYPDITITNPGNEGSIITVGGYDITTGALYINSGRGFAANGIIKPDIAAPAVDIEVPGELNLIYEITGTGMGAAVTAGAAALMLEWGIVMENVINMDTSTIRAMFIRGAKSPGVRVPDKGFGFGILDIYGAFQSLIY